MNDDNMIKALNTLAQYCTQERKSNCIDCVFNLGWQCGVREAFDGRKTVDSIMDYATERLRRKRK